MPTIKAKANAKQTAKQADASKQAVKVTQAVKAAVEAMFKQDAAVSVAQDEQGKKWLACGTTLAKECKDKDSAREVLKAAFAASIDPKTGKPRDPKDVKWSSYISKILALGFPANPENLNKAIKEDLKTGDLLSAARGTLKPKSGKWVKVETGEKRGGNRSQSSPYENLVKALRIAFTGAFTAKLKAKAYANAIIEASKGGMDAEAIAEELTDALASE